VLASSSSGGAAVVLFLFIVGVGLYFAPTIVAVTRKVTNQGSITVINIFFGWTLIGWVMALAMACRTSNLVRESVSAPSEATRQSG
jgi:hypothetical protein